MLLSLACTPAPEDKGATVLATVGQRQFTAADLNKVSDHVGTDGASDLDSWRHALQLLIDRELLLLEGRRQGLHESTVVRDAASASHRRSLTNALLERRYPGQLVPTEAEARTWYDSTNAGREIRVQRVVVNDRQVALSALRSADAAAFDLADVPESAVVSHMDLGWLTRLAIRDPRLASLFDRDVGSVELVESEGHFFLMHVSDERRVPFDERADMARSVLAGQRRSQVNMQYLEHLLSKYDVRIDTTASQKLAQTPDLTGLDPSQRLVHSALGDWTVGEYLGVVDRLGDDPTADASLAQGFRVTRAYVVAELLPRESEETGMADSLETIRQAALRRGTIEALWATEGFDAQSAQSEPERFERYLEELRARFADRVQVDDEAFAAYVAVRRQSDAPMDY